MSGEFRSLSPLIETRPSPNKGLGIFALQDLEQGDVITTELPICIIPTSTKDGRWKQLTEDDVRKSLSTATPEQQRDFHTLAEGSDPGRPPLVRKYRTNAFGYLTPETSCICLQLSRFNHSCLPNATWSIDRTSGRFLVRAVQPIRKKEEIFVCYIDHINTFATSDVRAKRLFASWRFICDCCACMPGQFQRCSDMRRSLLRHLRFLLLFGKNDILTRYGYSLSPSTMEDGKISKVHLTLERRTMYYFLTAELLMAEGIIGMDLVDAWDKASDTLLMRLNRKPIESISSSARLQALRNVKIWRHLAYQAQMRYRPEEFAIVYYLKSKSTEAKINHEEQLISCLD